MLHLASETEPGWAASMGAHLGELLLDHAHCEKKAASTAINLIFRYQPLVELMAPLSALAREELAHFELVLELLAERGETFGPRAPSPYASTLYQAVRPEEPHRLLDTLLVCSLIEARSCERMRLLSEGLDDPQLVALYGGLLASEARHHTTYVDLAVSRFGRPEVEQRLQELAQHEAQVLVQMPREPRMHSRAP
jgi:tRNA-(ms[2]io[6]A)-hydroxylase